MGINFDNKPCHQKLKHDCNKDKVGDLLLVLFRTNTFTFHLQEVIFKVKVFTKVFTLEMAYSMKKYESVRVVLE